MSINVWKLARRQSQGTNGAVEPLPVTLPHPASSLDGASASIPGGAYTTFRTYRGCYALRLEDHFERLIHTAELAGKPISLDRQTLRATLRRLAQSFSGGGDQRFRITIDLEQAPGDVYIFTEPLQVPAPADYAAGALAITCDLQRRLPEAKLTRFIERAGHVRQGLPPGINEAIMVDPQGWLREGLSSNFFAVRNGELWTAEQGVLAGITRATVLDCARSLAIVVHQQPVCQDDLGALDEAFITSASRGVLPLRRIDQTDLAAGAPGQVTRRLMQAFDQALEQEIEPI